MALPTYLARKGILQNIIDRFQMLRTRTKLVKLTTTIAHWTDAVGGAWFLRSVRVKIQLPGKSFGWNFKEIPAFYLSDFCCNVLLAKNRRILVYYWYECSIPFTWKIERVLRFVVCIYFVIKVNVWVYSDWFRESTSTMENIDWNWK